MSLVAVVSPVNAYVFTEYIRPRLQQFISGQGPRVKPLVRATYASCLATLAHTSSRILDMIQALRADGSVPTIDPEAEDGVDANAAYQNLFDVARQDLLDHFEAHTKALLTDSNSSVRRAFLGSVSSLCVFFGSSKANDVILSHLNTYLNDKDWMLKCAFFQAIVGVATFVGGTSLEEFILPLMIQALTDPEEFVVQKVLSSFASMAELGLFQRSKIWEMVDIVARFMIHPNIWIKEAAVHFISSATRYLSEADTYCIMFPLIQVYLKSSIMKFTETDILDALKNPLPRQVLDMAASWASSVPGGLFWKPVQQLRTFSFGFPDQALPTMSARDLRPNALSKIPKNEEDEKWLGRLRKQGMGTEDDFKLLALREYIWRMASRRPKEGAGNAPSPLNNIVTLKEMSITPQTIFFEGHQSKRNVRRRASHGEFRSTGTRKISPTLHHTIADALLDASTTVDDHLAPEKKSHLNVRKDRIQSVQPLPSNVKRDVSSPIQSSPIEQQRSRDSSTFASDVEERSPKLPPNKVGDRVKLGTDALTPAGSLRSGSAADRHGLKQKSSAINLLNKKDASKTLAETSTSSTNAFGRVDAPLVRDASQETHIARLNKGDEEPEISQIRAGHTYDGNDPNVLKLLDTLASENYPIDTVDFGPQVIPVRRRHLLKKSDVSENNKPWRPAGVLIATFGEHTGPINRVIISPDHAFFITGSDDGAVKVWDTLRLERNLAHRSRQTHQHADGAKVKCMCFVENTHTFVSCATDGSIHVVKVDCAHIGDTSKYGKLRLVREYHLSKDEHAVWVEHFKAEANSVLLLATNTSRIIAFDLRNMVILYSFENPVHHGTPTCFCVDYKHNWLLLGTSHGVLDLWDLRFQLRLKAWGLAGGSPIHRLHVHPFKGRGKWVCVAGGTGQTDITIWDLEKAQCREVFRAGISRSLSKDNMKIYEPWTVDDDKPEQSMLGRFAHAVDFLGNNTNSPDRGIRAVAIGVDGPDDGHESKYGFLLTGGLDKKLRFWDVSRVDISKVISGLQVEEDQPKYTTSHPTQALMLNTERSPQPGPSAPNAAAGNKSSSGSTAKKAGGRPPRSTVISLEQKHLLRSHLDSILDVAIIESPVGMTVSVDRAGVLYIFQ